MVGALAFVTVIAMLLIRKPSVVAALFVLFWVTSIAYVFGSVVGL